MKDENCIFCKIAAGEIPTQAVYEDDSYIAFKDLNPVAPVHLLLIPKAHIPSLMDAGKNATPEEEALLGALLIKAAKIAGEAGLESTRFVINSGTQAGQTVGHLHIHLLGGRDMQWPPG
jgi:histidine triad (HIT) family protein